MYIVIISQHIYSVLYIIIVLDKGISTCVLYSTSELYIYIVIITHLLSIIYNKKIVINSKYTTI